MREGTIASSGTISSSAVGGRVRAAMLLACAAMLAAGVTQTAVGAHGAAGNAGLARTAGGPAAHAARTIGGTDTAHLHLVHQHEMTLYEEGRATGALPGHMRAQLTVGVLFKGTCTIYTSGGSVDGRGIATPHGSGRYQSFSGTLRIVGGSGRFAHAHGRTGLYGTFDRRTFALVVQTSGRISY